MGRRAIGIVRVSERKGRDGERFASPKEQRERIEAACERDGLELVACYEEIDVSGGTPLARRHGLRRAVEAVEAGEAEVVIVAYFDRLVRSLRVQDEVVSRVERAGGRVVALDVGEVSNATAAQWLSGTMIGAVAEYYRRSVRERTSKAQELAVARGVVPWPKVPPGYRKRSDGRLEPDPELAPVVAEAFRMRAAGRPIREIRAYLADHGVRRSFHGVTSMLRSRIYLGEIHFGRLVNVQAHEPIISRDVWRRVQEIRVPRGRKPKSDRLLARLGILRCGTCGSRMVVATGLNSRYYVYRCPPTGSCERRMAISAEIAERVVVETVREALAGEYGEASADDDVRRAEAELARAQAELDAAIRAFRGLEDEPAARDRLLELREARDRAREHLDHLRGRSVALRISAAGDWDRLGLDARRAIIKATVERAVVMPGRGPSRVRVELFSK